MENLIILRKNKNKTQTQIAKVLNMSQQAYCKIEKGITSLSLEQAIILCNYYKITLDELLNIPKQKKPDMVEFEKKEELTDKQKELLELIKNMNNDDVNKIIGFAYGLSEKELTAEEKIQKLLKENKK